MSWKSAALALAFALAPASAWALDVVKTASSAVSTKGVVVGLGTANISLDDFEKVILDCSAYPLTAKYGGVPALTECKNLGKADGYSVAYQRTGGNFLLSPRHYVIALKTTEKTATKVVIQWWLVKHDGTAGAFSGPYASTLNAHADHVYTPYNAGSWTLDLTARTVTYKAGSDPGGSIPDSFVNTDAVSAFAKELLRVKWGVDVSSVKGI